MKISAPFFRFVSYPAAGVILAAAGFLLLGSSGRDDAHITYWASHALANFGEIVNYNGDRVEQSSSLLQVVLLAFAETFTGLDVVTLGKFSSIIFGVLSVIAAGIFAENLTKSFFHGLFAALLVSAYPYVIYWSYGGLESTLVSFAGFLILFAISDFVKFGGLKRLLFACLAMLAFALVRPETIILLAGMFSAAIVFLLFKQYIHSSVQRGMLSNMLKLTGAYLLITLLILCFRYFYFGDFFPQPVTAKTNGVSMDVLSDGAAYLQVNLWDAGAGFALLSAGMAASASFMLFDILRPKSLNFDFLLTLLYIAGYVAFVIFTGGDWMEGGRFLVNVLPIALAAIPISLSYLLPKPKPAFFLMLLLILVEFSSFIFFTRKASTGTPLWARISFPRSYSAAEYSWFERRNRVNMRDTYLIDYLDYLIVELSQHHKPVTIMSAQMGIVPYHLSQKHYGAIQFLDRARLVDRSFSRCSTLNPVGISPGERASYQYYFANLESVLQTCGIPAPDIIFDTVVSDLTREMLVANNYVLVFMQNGEVRSNAGWLENYEVKALQMAGLRRDLFEALDIKPVFIKFSN